MAPKSVPSSDMPLHRLLKRQEAAALLAEFGSLLPEGDLALIGADGRVYAGSEEWSRAELQRWQARAGEGQVRHAGGVVFQPVFVQSRYVGALVARTGGDASPGPLVERTLRCLQTSLTLLLHQALETRDVVSETLARYREVNLLYRMGETIGHCLDAEEIPRLVLDEVHRIIEADVGAVILSAESATDTGEGVRSVVASFGADECVREWHEACQEVIERACGTGQPTIADATGISKPADTEIGSVLCAPIKTPERTLGTLVLGRSREQAEFTAGDGKLAMALAHQAAISMETARLHQEEVKRQRLEQELAVGRQIQLTLLPKDLPAVPGWEFAAFYQPARQVGGDFYDFFALPGQRHRREQAVLGHRLGLVIADVTDKGVPAALMMAVSRTIVRATAASGRRPAAALKLANTLMLKDSWSDLFVTAFYAVLEPHSGRLTYANAGHNRPLWVQSGTGQVHELAAHGIALGVQKAIKLEEREIDVVPGDTLVFYTDGVTDAMDSAGQLFDVERLRAAVVASPPVSAQQVLSAVVDAIGTFTGGAPQSDDLTLLVVRRRDGEA